MGIDRAGDGRRMNTAERTARRHCCAAGGGDHGVVEVATAAACWCCAPTPSTWPTVAGVSSRRAIRRAVRACSPCRGARHGRDRLVRADLQRALASNVWSAGRLHPDEFDGGLPPAARHRRPGPAHLRRASGWRRWMVSMSPASRRIARGSPSVPPSDALSAQAPTPRGRYGGRPRRAPRGAGAAAPGRARGTRCPPVPAA